MSSVSRTLGAPYGRNGVGVDYRCRLRRHRDVRYSAALVPTDLELAFEMPAPRQPANGLPCHYVAAVHLVGLRRSLCSRGRSPMPSKLGV